MAILYGTQSNGETLPVLVDQFGNLLAKGINGEQGPPGPPGAPGVGELPPGATDGALLGWENGELVWVIQPLPPVVVPGFRPVIYNGNGGSQSITDVGFSPSLVWIKSRTDPLNHSLFDVVRGNDKRIASNLSEGEISDTSFASFDANGFTLNGNNTVNGSAKGYVAWSWNAGDTTVSNNDGTITSQVRAEPSAGFSIVSWVGTSASATLGHGLNSSPELIIVKNRSASADWPVYHSAIGAGNRTYLSVNAASSSGGNWNSTPPTNSVFSVGANLDTNELDSNMIAYCWAETPGVSSFGKYAGGGRQTIVTDFRPSLVIIKSTGMGNWFMFDNARGAANALYANAADLEADTGVIEFLDDGFQLLFNLPGVNESNETYIYAAFANPLDAAIAQRQLRRQARQEQIQQNETRLR